MTIHATKTDVDEATTGLLTALKELVYAARDWHTYPSQDVQRRSVRNAFDTASEAFDKHAETLATWAAGPSGDDRG